MYSDQSFSDSFLPVLLIANLMTFGLQFWVFNSKSSATIALYAVTLYMRNDTALTAMLTKVTEWFKKEDFQKFEESVYMTAIQSLKGYIINSQIQAHV